MRVRLNSIKVSSMENNLTDARNGLLMLEKQDQNDDFDLLNNDNKLEILNFALTRSVSIYWPNLALNWIEKNPNIINDALKGTLLMSINEPWAKQDFKQKVKRVLRGNSN